LIDMSELTVEIAGICCQISFDNKDFARLLKHRLDGFFSSRSPNISIKIEFNNKLSPNSISPLAVINPVTEVTFKNSRIMMEGSDFAGIFYTATGIGHICQPHGVLYPFDSFLRLIYSFYLIKENGFFLHSAAVERRDNGYVFFGPSGSGKSTVAALSAECCLNDELAVIKKTGATYRVFGTPYWTGENRSVPLRALFSLKKDRRVALVELPAGRAVGQLLNSVKSGLADAWFYREIFAVASGLLEKVPCYDMHFLPDNSFWPHVDEVCRQ